MKCSLGISHFLEEISSFPFCCFPLFALITEEGFLISPCYSLELCIQMFISFLSFFAFSFSSFLSYLQGLLRHLFCFLHFLYFFALITEESFLLFPFCSLELYIQMDITSLFTLAFCFSSFLSYLQGLLRQPFCLFCIYVSLVVDLIMASCTML